MLKKVKYIYFLGIGGAGMSALAHYFYSLGKTVLGYDRVESHNTKMLFQKGIDIIFEDDIEKIYQDINTENTMVIYTPAIPKENKILLYFQQNNFSLKKRAEVLGMITKDTYCMAVAGTHGKTTTTAILAHIMKESDVPTTSFLGGISQNYNSNLVIGGSEVSVVEADEFDKSFLQLYPNMCCVTSMDADHLDIYKNAEELVKYFHIFLDKVSDKKNIIAKKGLPLYGVTTYSVDQVADFYATDISIENGNYHFTLVTPKEKFIGMQIVALGKHNLENTIVAITMAYKKGVCLEVIKKALQSFKGVHRRFNYHIKNENCIYIDDYAHHPEEIKATVLAVKKMYPQKKILGIFQPHLFSRTKDFVEPFAQSLALLDELFLLDIYPAREKPIEGVTSQWLLEKVNLNNKKMVLKNNLISYLKQSNFDVVLSLGAGDIGELVKDIKNALI